MKEPNKVKIDKIQLALFFPINTDIKSIDAAAEISKKLGYIFNDDPNIITLPPVAPVEIPKIIFNAPEGIQLSIGNSRADFVIQNINEEYRIEYFIDIANKLWNILVDSLKIKIIRIGVVTDYVYSDNFELKEFLGDQKTFNLKEIDEFNIAWLKKISLKDLKINNWTRLSSIKSQGKNTISVDMNTDVNIALNLNESSFIELLNVLLKEIQGVVNNAI